MKYAYLGLIVLAAALTTSCASLREKTENPESATEAAAASARENAKKEEARKEEARKREEARKKEEARKEEEARREEAKAAAEAEAAGKPAAGSKFAKLKLGMTLGEVQKLIGQPAKQWRHRTDKASIPFYFGPDRWVILCAYRHEGVLTFNSGGDQALTLIEVNRAE